MHPDVDTKVCTRCRERKPRTDFCRNRGNPDGLHGYCRPCHAEYQRARGGGTARKSERLRSRYGIDLDQFESMKEAQGGRCAVCGDETTLVVDHDHESNEVRGLLCHLCNRGLGHFLDDPVRLQGAIAYLTTRG